MDKSAYLNRIKHAEPAKPDAETFRRLQTVHMGHVPFENLDIGLKRTRCLDERSFWEKIIVNKRGGFCYELNGLFDENSSARHTTMRARLYSTSPK